MILTRRRRRRRLREIGEQSENVVRRQRRLAEEWRLLEERRLELLREAMSLNPRIVVSANGDGTKEER